MASIWSIVITAWTGQSAVNAWHPSRDASTKGTRGNNACGWQTNKQTLPKDSWHAAHTNRRSQFDVQPRLGSRYSGWRDYRSADIEDLAHGDAVRHGLEQSREGGPAHRGGMVE
jgi:hypothetical protein